MTTEQKIRDIIADLLGCDDIANDAHIVDDLGADSMDIAELLSAMEEEFNIDISDEDAQTITTLQAAIDYVENYDG